MRNRLLLPIAAMSLWAAGPVGGQLTPPVRIGGARPGISFQAGSNGWNQVVVRVINESKEDRRVFLDMVSQLSSSGRVVFRRPLALPARSDRELFFYVRLGEVDVKKNILGHLRLMDAESQTLLHTQTLLGKMGQSFFIHVEDNIGAERTTSFLDKWLPEVVSGGLSLSSCPARQLPDRWLGLDQAKIIALGGAKLDAIPPAGRKALLDWVRNGGLLLACVGDAAETYRRSWLAPWLPVRIFGQRQVSRFHLDDGKKTVEISYPPPKAYLVAEAEPIAGKVLYRGAEFPWVVSRSLGAGRIVYVSMPLAALAPTPKTSEALRPIWRAMTAPGSTPPQLARTKMMKSKGKFLAQSIGVKVPQVQLIAIGGGGLLGAFLLVSLLFRRTQREWGWVVFGTLAILMTLVLLGWGRRARRQIGAAAGEIGMIVLGEDNRSGKLTSMVGLFSPSHDRPNLIAETPQLALVPMAEKAAKGKGQIVTRIVEQTWRFGTGDADIRPGQLTPYLVESLYQPKGKLTANVYFGPNGLEGTLHNQLGFDLLDVMVIRDGYPFSVGRLGDGEQKAVLCNADTARAREQFTPADILGTVDRMRMEATRLMLTPSMPTGPRLNRTGTWLIGWSSQVRQPITVNGYNRRAESLIILPLRIGPTPAGTSVRIPPAFVDFNLERGSSPVFNPMTREWYHSHNRGELTIDFSPPPEVGKLRLTKLTFHCDVQAARYRLDVQARDRSGNYLPIKSLTSPTGKFNWSLPGAERFAQADGHIVIRLKMTPMFRVAPTGQNFSNWIIRGVRLTVEGRAEKLRRK